MSELGQMRWPEVAGQPVVLVPLGSCEQHGPHLPLATDATIAVAIAAGAAHGHANVVVAPVLAYGASGEHAGFPGTLSMGTDALIMVLVELARSNDWAASIVFVNGHGGNTDAVRQAVTQCRHEGRSVSAWWPTIPGGDAHAGHTETSLLLALGVPVRMDCAEPGVTEPLSAILPTLRRGGVRAVSPNGVLGDPTGASADHGRVVLINLIADLRRHLDTIAST